MTPGRLMQPLYGGGYSDAFAAKIVPGETAPAWSGYLGGTPRDHAQEIDAGPDGSAYVGGGTSSPDFPIFEARQATSDADPAGWLAKVNPDSSSLAWSTMHNGNVPGSVSAIVVDPQDNVHVAGTTGAEDFPVTEDAIRSEFAGGRGDAYLSTFSSDGELTFSTYLGGSGDDDEGGLALRKDGMLILSVSTYSTDFPVADKGRAAKRHEPPCPGEGGVRG